MTKEQLTKGQPKKHSFTITLTDKTGTYRSDGVKNLIVDSLVNNLNKEGRLVDFEDVSVSARPIKKAKSKA